MGDLDSFLSFIFPVVLFLLFVSQSFYIESFIIENDSFIHLTEFLIFKINRVEIPFISIVNIERIQNVQLLVRFIINYYNKETELTQFYLRTSNLFLYRFLNPNFDNIIKEISLASGKEIIRKFE